MSAYVRVRVRVRVCVCACVQQQACVHIAECHPGGVLKFVNYLPGSYSIRFLLVTLT